jgi:hypothetical protein
MQGAVKRLDGVEIACEERAGHVGFFEVARCCGELLGTKGRVSYEGFEVGVAQSEDVWLYVWRLRVSEQDVDKEPVSAKSTIPRHAEDALHFKTSVDEGSGTVLPAVPVSGVDVGDVEALLDPL